MPFNAKEYADRLGVEPGYLSIMMRQMDKDAFVYMQDYGVKPEGKDDLIDAYSAHLREKLAGTEKERLDAIFSVIRNMEKGYEKAIDTVFSEEAKFLAGKKFNKKTMLRDAYAGKKSNKQASVIIEQSTEMTRALSLVDKVFGSQDELKKILDNEVSNYYGHKVGEIAKVLNSSMRVSSVQDAENLIDRTTSITGAKFGLLGSNGTVKDFTPYLDPLLGDNFTSAMSKIRTIPKLLHARVGKVVRRAYLGAKSMEQTKRDLVAEFGITERHATTILRTEHGKLQNAFVQNFATDIKKSPHSIPMVKVWLHSTGSGLEEEEVVVGKETPKPTVTEQQKPVPVKPVTPEAILAKVPEPAKPTYEMNGQELVEHLSGIERAREEYAKNRQYPIEATNKADNEWRDALNEYHKRAREGADDEELSKLSMRVSTLKRTLDDVIDNYTKESESEKVFDEEFNKAIRIAPDRMLAKLPAGFSNAVKQQATKDKRTKKWCDGIQSGLDFVRTVMDKDVLPNGKWQVLTAARDGRSQYNLKTGTMELDTGLSTFTAPVTTTHEYGHHIEHNNKEISAARRKFFDKRTAGEETEQLSKVTGHSGYRDNEVTKKDKWPDAYCGKVYSGADSSEIISMGIQYLRKPMEFFKKDPEYFAFTINALRNKFAKSSVERDYTDIRTTHDQFKTGTYKIPDDEKTAQNYYRDRITMEDGGTFEKRFKQYMSSSDPAPDMLRKAVLSGVSMKLRRELKNSNKEAYNDALNMVVSFDNAIDNAPLMPARTLFKLDTEDILKFNENDPNAIVGKRIEHKDYIVGTPDPKAIMKKANNKKKPNVVMHIDTQPKAKGVLLGTEEEPVFMTERGKTLRVKNVEKENRTDGTTIFHVYAEVVYDTKTLSIAEAADKSRRLKYEPRRNHKAMHKVKVLQDGKFSLFVPELNATVEVDGPYDNALPASQIVNCHCKTVLRFDDDEVKKLLDKEAESKDVGTPKPAPAPTKVPKPAPAPKPVVKPIEVEKPKPIVPDIKPIVKPEPVEVKKQNPFAAGKSLNEVAKFFKDNPDEYKKLVDAVRKNSDRTVKHPDGDQVSKYLNELCGYDAKPQKVSKEKLDSLGAKIQYRGMEKMQQGNQFINEEEVFHGSGIFGQGTYSAYGGYSDHALEYAQGKDSSMVRFVLDKDAKVAVFSELVAKRQNEYFKYKDKKNKYDPEDPIHTIAELFKDTGYAATFYGYDAINVIHKPDEKDMGGYVVTLNRGKVIADETVYRVADLNQEVLKETKDYKKKASRPIVATKSIVEKPKPVEVEKPKPIVESENEYNKRLSAHFSKVKDKSIARAKRSFNSLDADVKEQFGVKTYEEFVAKYAADYNAKQEEAIRNADVVIRMTDVTLSKVLKDGKIKTLHETGTSGGSTNADLRGQVENMLFGVESTKNPDDLPVYGYLKNKEKDSTTASQYGGVIVKLKDEVRNRASFTYGDSLNRNFRGFNEVPQTLTGMKHAEHTVSGLEHMQRSVLNKGKDKDDFDPTTWVEYAEVQVFGGVRVTDIEKVTFSFGKKSTKKDYSIKKELDESKEIYKLKTGRTMDSTPGSIAIKALDHVTSKEDYLDVVAPFAKAKVNYDLAAPSLSNNTEKQLKKLGVGVELENIPTPDMMLTVFSSSPVVGLHYLVREKGMEFHAAIDHMKKAKNMIVGLTYESELTKIQEAFK